MFIETLKALAGLIVSYLLGSLPTAYLVGKSRGLDLRQHGSGNLGATNTFRVLGKNAGIFVLCIDILKGTAAVLLARKLFYEPVGGMEGSLYACLSAVCAVSGHNWTIFLGFKGGKGMATSLGAMIAFAILVDRFGILLYWILMTWVIVFLSTGFVSLASVLCSLLVPLMGLALRLPASIEIFMTILALFSLFRHRENIKRLLAKKEHRFNTSSLFHKILRKKSV